MLGTVAAAAISLFGGSGYAQDAQQPAAQEQKPVPRQKLTKEMEFEHSAFQAYVEGRRMYDLDQRASSVTHFLKSRKFYNAAEAVEPKDELFAEQRASIDEWIAVAKYNKAVKDLSSEQRSELARVIGDYEQGVVAPQPAQPQTLPPQPAQGSVPADLATPLQGQAASKSHVQKGSIWCPQCAEIGTLQDGPLGADMLSIRGAVGPELREIDAYGRFGGFEAYAGFSRNAFKTENDSDFSTKRFGGYVALDGDTLIGLPLYLDASVSKTEDLLQSSSDSVTDDANFTVTEHTDTDTLTERTRFSAGAKMRLEPYQIEARVYQLEENIGVNAVTNLSVVNKNDLLGNYSDVIVNSQSFKNTTLGGQFGVASFISEEASGGLQLTLEHQDLPDVDRSINYHRGNVWLHYLAKDRKKGLHVIVGQGLIDDSGEKLTRGEYGITGTAELSDLVLASARFTHHEHPQGSLAFLIGKNSYSDAKQNKIVRAVPYVADNQIARVKIELNLDKRMDLQMLREYMEIQDADLLRWLAQMQEWQFMPRFGVGEVEELGKERIVYNWDVTLLAPVFKDVTLGVRGYGEEDIMGKRHGVEVMAFPVGKNWRIAIRGEEETLPGQGEKDKRGLVIFDVWNK